MNKMATAKALEEIVRELSPEERHELEDHAVQLWERKTRSKRQPPKFEWAGCLKDFDPSLSSVDIQHLIAEWRIKDL